MSATKAWSSVTSTKLPKGESHLIDGVGLVMAYEMNSRNLTKELFKGINHSVLKGYVLMSDCDGDACVIDCEKGLLWYDDEAEWLEISDTSLASDGDITFVAEDNRFTFDTTDEVFVTEVTWARLKLNKNQYAKYIIALAIETGTTNTSGEVTTMNSIKDTAKKTANSHKEGALLLAKITTGKAALAIATKAIEPKLPEQLKAFAGTVYGDLVIASIASLAINQFASENGKGVIVAQAMVDASWLEFGQVFDINEFINEMMDGLDASKLEQLAEK